MTHYPLVMSEASGGADCEFIHMKMIQISNDNQLIKKELYQYLRNLEFCWKRLMAMGLWPFRPHVKWLQDNLTGKASYKIWVQTILPIGGNYVFWPHSFFHSSTSIFVCKNIHVYARTTRTCTWDFLGTSVDMFLHEAKTYGAGAQTCSRILIRIKILWRWSRPFFSELVRIGSWSRS